MSYPKRLVAWHTTINRLCVIPKGTGHLAYNNQQTLCHTQRDWSLGIQQSTDSVSYQKGLVAWHTTINRLCVIPKETGCLAFNKVQALCHTKRDWSLVIQGTGSVSYQKGLVSCHTTINRLCVIPKETGCLSYNNKQTLCHTKRDWSLVIQQSTDSVSYQKRLVAWHSIRCRLCVIPKGTGHLSYNKVQGLCHTKKDWSLVIQGTGCVSYQKGLVTCHAQMDWFLIIQYGHNV